MGGGGGAAGRRRGCGGEWRREGLYPRSHGAAVRLGVSLCYSTVPALVLRVRRRHGGNDLADINRAVGAGENPVPGGGGSSLWRGPTNSAHGDSPIAQNNPSSNRNARFVRRKSHELRSGVSTDGPILSLSRPD